ASQSPTLTKNTALGAILGTASYMSPEQARGKTVDKRTDIWAFGCCLFEALAGRRAFEGETVADVLSKVLQREPEWSALPRGIPRALRRLMKKCLEKDPDRRVHDIADAGLELEESLSAPPAAETHLQSRTLVLAIAGAAIAGALASFLLVRPTPPPRAVQRFSINLPPGDEFLVGGIEGPLVAISPDGSDVVYAGVRNGEAQLFLRPVDRDLAEPIAGTRNGRMPFFSPDGEWIGFSAGRELKKVAVLGGAPVTLVQMEGADHLGGTWTRDGRIFASIDGLLIWISEGGGPSTTLSFDDAVDERTRAWWPHVLPGGKAILFGSVRSGTPSIVILSLETGETRVLVEDGRFPRYAKSGRLLFARKGTVFAAPFDLERLSLTGSPVPVLENVGQGGAGEAYYDLSDDGTLVYVSGQTKPETGLSWIDREGTGRPFGPRRRATWSSPRLSPNGELIAASLEPQDAPPDIWLLDTDPATLTRLTTAVGLQGVWAPDGRSVFIQSDARIFRQELDAAGEAQDVAPCYNLTSISSDGTLAVCQGPNEAGDWDIESVRLDGSGERRKVVGTRFDEYGARFSPDDRWLAYVSDESGQEEIYVQPFPGPGRKRRASTNGGSEPAWSRDGRELFYRRGREMYVVSFANDGIFGEPTRLFSGDFESGYDVSLDGRQFLMIQSEPTDVRPEIHVVLDWFEELERLVPPR
ncbi:MAG TPA: protein kinase, partial [Vicinamibacteria bacterium]|nr:protein kinase [Vicinamibacteria bacterium]